MKTYGYTKNQDLNQWVSMLSDIYGSTQNYSKSPYEIYTHLVEVCALFGRNLFKSHDFNAAQDFLPKIFAWAVALLKSMNHKNHNLEEIILRKFPGVCPYCLKAPCICSEKGKPTLDENKLNYEYNQNSALMDRSVNDFQLMFTKIYGKNREDIVATNLEYQEQLRQMFTRMVEELAEVAESIRFYHLYPKNFENEIADLFAWWFAFVQCFPNNSGNGNILAEDILWRAYPGYCPYCNLIPCFCRPKPVRELISKPAPGQEHMYDYLTALYNQQAFLSDIQHIRDGLMPVTLPATCVRIDIDKFKTVNDDYGHLAGDKTLRHIATILRLKVKEGDRTYRAGGDEFGILLFDETEEEAIGMMKRIYKELSDKPVPWRDADGNEQQIAVTISSGIAECNSLQTIELIHDYADQACYISKEKGGAQIISHSEINRKDK